MRLSLSKLALTEGAEREGGGAGFPNALGHGQWEQPGSDRMVKGQAWDGEGPEL